MIIYDDNTYYCFGAIEKERDLLLRCNDEIYVYDLGTGRSCERRISDIAYRALESPTIAQMLFRIANSLGNKHIIELGTCFGITSSYLASVGSDTEVVTFEGSSEEIRIAKRLWQRLDLKNITVVEGDISDRLDEYLGRYGNTIGMAFIDANHSKEPTIRYFNSLAGYADEKTIIAIDDIHHSQEMLKAWNTIREDKRVTATIDCFNVGLIFFNKSLEKRNYKIRL